MSGLVNRARSPSPHDLHNLTRPFSSHTQKSHLPSSKYSDCDRNLLLSMKQPYVQTTETILRKFKHCKPSLVVHLYPNNWRFDQQDGSFGYNSPMSIFLKHVREQTVPHDMLEELMIANVTFYDGCLIVAIHDHRGESKKSSDGSTKSTEKNESIPFSVHNWNEHLTPSPHYLYSKQSTKKLLGSFANPSQSKQQQLQSHSLAQPLSNNPSKISTGSNNAPSSSTATVKSGQGVVRTFTTVLFATPLSRHEDMRILLSRSLAMASQINSNQSRHSPKADEQSGKSGSTSHPIDSESIGDWARFVADPDYQHEFETEVLLRTEKPLYLGPARDMREAQGILELLRDPQHSHTKVRTSRKRTVAEVAAHEAQAAEDERFLLLCDERLAPSSIIVVGSNGNKECQSGIPFFEPDFSRFKRLESIKIEHEKREQLRREELKNAQIQRQQVEKARAEKSEKPIIHDSPENLKNIKLLQVKQLQHQKVQQHPEPSAVKSPIQVTQPSQPQAAAQVASTQQQQGPVLPRKSGDALSSRQSSVGAKSPHAVQAEGASSPRPGAQTNIQVTPRLKDQRSPPRAVKTVQGQAASSNSTSTQAQVQAQAQSQAQVQAHVQAQAQAHVQAQAQAQVQAQAQAQVQAQAQAQVQAQAQAQAQMKQQQQFLQLKQLEQEKQQERLQQQLLLLQQQQQLQLHQQHLQQQAQHQYQLQQQQQQHLQQLQLQKHMQMQRQLSKQQHSSGPTNPPPPQSLAQISPHGQPMSVNRLELSPVPGSVPGVSGKMVTPMHMMNGHATTVPMLPQGSAIGQPGNGVPPASNTPQCMARQLSQHGQQIVNSAPMPGQVINNRTVSSVQPQSQPQQQQHHHINVSAGNRHDSPQPGGNSGSLGSPNSMIPGTPVMNNIVASSGAVMPNSHASGSGFRGQQIRNMQQLLFQQQQQHKQRPAQPPGTQMPNEQAALAAANQSQVVQQQQQVILNGQTAAPAHFRRVNRPSSASGEIVSNATINMGEPVTAIQQEYRNQLQRTMQSQPGQMIPGSGSAQPILTVERQKQQISSVRNTPTMANHNLSNNAGTPPGLNIGSNHHVNQSIETMQGLPAAPPPSMIQGQMTTMNTSGTISSTSGLQTHGGSANSPSPILGGTHSVQNTSTGTSTQTPSGPAITSTTPSTGPMHVPISVGGGATPLNIQQVRMTIHSLRSQALRKYQHLLQTGNGSVHPQNIQALIQQFYNALIQSGISSQIAVNAPNILLSAIHQLNSVTAAAAAAASSTPTPSGSLPPQTHQQSLPVNSSSIPLQHAHSITPTTSIAAPSIPSNTTPTLSSPLPPSSSSQTHPTNS